MTNSERRSGYAHVPATPAGQSWTQQDLTILAGLAVVAAVGIAIGFAGATRVQSVAGLALILALAYCLSAARRAIDYRSVAWGLGLQFLFALIVLKTTVGRTTFEAVGGVITRLLNFSVEGSKFVFGPLGEPTVWAEIVTRVLGPAADPYKNLFAFMVLPTIIFIAALFAMLYYFGIMQVIVRLFAVVMRRFMRASGAESLNVAASIFMGQTEASRTIRPILPRLTEYAMVRVLTAAVA